MVLRLPSVLKAAIAPLISLITPKINGSDRGGPQALASCPWLALGITDASAVAQFIVPQHVWEGILFISFLPDRVPPGIANSALIPSFLSTRITIEQFGHMIRTAK